MDYELAKQLKEAGFPQFHRYSWDTFYSASGDLVLTSDQIAPLRTEAGMMVSHSDFVKRPTLEELIEACGDDFVRLRKSGSLWEAWGYFLKNGHDIHALTPTEAVARLWLALNTK